MKLPRYTKRSLVALSLAGALAFNLANSRGLPPSEGIRNFGKVNDVLYRGAQPDGAAIKHLKELGITTIINLRTKAEISATEETEARSAGLLYTNMPLEGLGRPTDAQVSQILSVIEHSPGPVFVHCKHGCDRTGTIIACYRLEHDHWTSDAALQEAGTYGLSRLERGMRQYVLDFAKAMELKTNLPPQSR